MCHNRKLTLVPARFHLVLFLFSSCHRLGKGKYEDGDGINLNDIEKVLPVWQVGDEDISCPRYGGDQQLSALPFLRRPSPEVGKPGLDALSYGPLRFVMENCACGFSKPCCEP